MANLASRSFNHALLNGQPLLHAILSCSDVLMSAFCNEREGKESTHACQSHAETLSVKITMLSASVLNGFP